MPPPSSLAALARVLAPGTAARDLLPELHGALLASTRGSSSLLFQRPGRNRPFVATSGRGADRLGAELPEAETAALSDLLQPATLLDLSILPVLSASLTARRALVIKIEGARADAIVIVGDPEIDAAAAAEIGATAGLQFGIALEWSRLAAERSFHDRLREFSLAFSRTASAPLNLSPGLEALAHDTNALLGTDVVSIWLHDRRARELTLSACSTAGDDAAPPCRVSVDDPTAPAALGLRLARPELLLTASNPVLIAPLRGWRRALGTLVLEGRATHELSDDQLTDLVHDLARQLAVAIETVQLVDDIAAQRRVLEDTFNSVIDLIVVTDNAMRVIHANDAFGARVASDPAALMERPLDTLIEPDMVAWIAGTGGHTRDDAAGGSYAPRARVFESGVLAGTFLATLTPLVNAEGTLVGRVLTARDVTAQLRLERERETLRARLAQSEKLAALGQFVAGVAHEMNNPLQGVLGHLELLIDRSEAARPVRRDLRRIYREGNRAAQIVRNLLVFTGARHATRQRLKIDRVISRALSSRRAAFARNGIDIRRAYSDDVPPIVGDPLLLQQAFLNVLINAEHAIGQTGTDGVIEVETGCSADRKRVTATIRDSGGGIADDVLPRIFDPFFTTKDIGKGTGLGLAITYGILQEHGGSISAANQPGGGAVFTVQLPAEERE
jgi:signal transduction histidine kinase